MNKNLFITLILLAGIAVVVGLFREPEEETGIPLTSTPYMLTDGDYCFYRLQEATDAAPYRVEEHVALHIAGDTVTGEKDGTQAGPDMTNGYEGTLVGSRAGNDLDVVFAYTIEGSSNSEREFYEWSEDVLTKLRYPLVEKDGMLVPDETKDATPIVYTGVPCESP